MKRYLIIIVLQIVFSNMKAQDAQFSQFYSNPLYLAPSFAGSAENSRFIMNYRDQWPSIPGNYVTYSFSADHYFKSLRSGMGLILFKDQAGGGKLSTINIGYLYSYKIPVTRKFAIQPGLSAYYYSRKIDYTMLNFSDQFFGSQFVGSSSEILPSQTVQHVDFAFSCLGYSPNFWFGTTLDHLMKLSSVLKSDTKYSSMRFSLFGGVKKIVKKRYHSRDNETIHLAFNFRHQSDINQLDVGLYYFKNPLLFGIWYRGIPVGNLYSTNDAIIYLVGVRTRNLTISYSYDMTIGQLISKTGGSHEIAVSYSLNDLDNFLLRKRMHSIPCPDL